MTNIYTLKNQHNAFLTKSGEWITPKNNDRSLFFCLHKDEAINTKIEISVKDAELRVCVIETQLNDKKAPIIDEKYFASVSLIPNEEDHCHDDLEKMV